MNKEIEIPKGYEARIEGNKIILELKESEDERIRKSIVHLLQVGGYMPDEEKKAFAYLERQKEQKWSPSEGEMGVLYKLCYISNQVTDEDDAELTRLYQDLKQEYFNGHSFENMFPSEKQKKQQPALDDYLKATLAERRKMSMTEILEKEQQSAEWSEKDVEKLAKIRASKSGVLTSEMTFYRQGVRDAFNYKGLHPSWKPSEEQMNALNSIILNGSFTYVGQVQDLISLKDELKKL